MQAGPYRSGKTVKSKQAESMQRRFRSCERFGKRSVVPRYSYDSRGRQDRPESAERMQEPIKRGGSDAGTDLRPAPTNRPPADIQIMLRNQLSAAVESAAQELGYGFRQGFEYRMGEVPIRFPAVWLVPPHVVRVEGREEGEIVYRATLHLMRLDRRYDEQAKERQWAEMERDALAMIGRIGKLQGIFCTGNIALTPAEFSLTRQGELSMKAEFDARLYFPNEPDDKP